MRHEGQPTQFSLASDWSGGAVAESPLVHANFPVFRVRLVRENREGLAERREMDGPEDVAGVFAEHLEDADREHFCVMMLCTQNRLIAASHRLGRNPERRPGLAARGLEGRHFGQRRERHRGPPLGRSVTLSRGRAGDERPAEGGRAARYPGARPCRHRRRGPLRLLEAHGALRPDALTSRGARRSSERPLVEIHPAVGIRVRGRKNALRSGLRWCLRSSSRCTVPSLSHIVRWYSGASSMPR